MTRKMGFLKYFKEKLRGILVCKKERDIIIMPTSASLQFGGKRCCNRCPLMCEVKRETDRQNTLYNPGGECAVGPRKVH
jgi:hypothetical protein